MTATSDRPTSSTSQTAAPAAAAGSEQLTADPTGPIPVLPDDAARLDVEARSEEHTSELQSRGHLVCRLLLEKKKNFTEGLASGTHKNISRLTREESRVVLQVASDRERC